jgi:hypothetical protein
MHQVISDPHARQSRGERFELQQIPRNDLHVAGEQLGEDLGLTGDAPHPTPLVHEPVQQPASDVPGRTSEQDRFRVGGGHRDASNDSLPPSADRVRHRCTLTALQVTGTILENGHGNATIVSRPCRRRSRRWNWSRAGGAGGA